MSTIAVVGAGNGGLAAAADMTLKGHDVRLCNRSAPVLDAVTQLGGILISGALGEQTIAVADATTDIARAIDGADVVMVVLPASAHGDIAQRLAGNVAHGVPVILNPGHMCGSLHFRRAMAEQGCRPPSVVELGTLAYVCRSQSLGAVDIYLRAANVPAAVVPDGDDAGRAIIESLYPGVRIMHPIAAWLHDVNMVLHPPGMILGAAWIEATGGNFGFYSEGVTPAVAAVMQQLDEERIAVGGAYGFELDDLAKTMAALGTADPGATDLRAAVAGGEANRSITAPDALDHRYITEDVPYGLVPLTALAAAAGVHTPVAAALIELATTIAGRDLHADGLNARRLGIDQLGAQEIQEVAAR